MCLSESLCVLARSFQQLAMAVVAFDGFTVLVVEIGSYSPASPIAEQVKSSSTTFQYD